MVTDLTVCVLAQAWDRRVKHAVSGDHRSGRPRARADGVFLGHLGTVQPPAPHRHHLPSHLSYVAFSCCLPMTKISCHRLGRRSCAVPSS